LDSLNNLGLILYRKGDFAGATTLFDKLSGLNPGSIAAKLNLGSCAAKSGDLKKAIGAWKDVIRAEPKRSDVRMDLANALYAEGDAEGARYHYLQILNTDKNNAEALNGIGLCHLKTGKLAQAEAAFRSAIESDSKLIPAYNNLAVTLQRMNQLNEAVKVLERAVKIAPDDEDLRRNLARMRGEE
jgi:Flp pilus assembly protein TadD